MQNSDASETDIGRLTIVTRFKPRDKVSYKRAGAVVNAIILTVKTHTSMLGGTNVMYSVVSGCCGIEEVVESNLTATPESNILTDVNLIGSNQ